MNKVLTYIVAAAMLAVGCGNPAGTATQTLPAPTGLTLARTTTSSLTYVWDSVSNARQYGWKLTADGDVTVKEGLTSSVSVTCYGLTQGKTYYMSVRSVSEDAMSDYCAPVEGVPAEPSDEPQNPDKPDTPDTPDTPDDPDPVPADQVYESMKIPAVEEDGVARAFPGAEGGAMYITGGRGGKVIHVTNLNDSGEGSLRAAVSASGARTIVFDVAGIITLKSPLNIKYGDVTIAGQTAPGDGICVKGRYTQINADNVIIRYVRFRLGDEDPNASDSDDAIWSRYHKNIILDHCSMSWSIDECASFYANSNMTMQWCIIAESMRSCSLHSKGDHGYGGIWGGENVSFHHNILAHHDSRNPRFDHPHIYENHNTVPQRGVIDYRNNVVYNWGSNNSYGGEGYGAGKGTGINMVGNYYKPGPSSSDKKYIMDSYGVYSSCSSCGKNIDEGYPLIYMSGNVHTKYSDITSDNAKGIYWHNGDSHVNYGKTASSAFAVKGQSGQTCYTTTHSAEDAMKAACEYAGASLAKDKVDARVASHVKNGTGKIIDCVVETSGKTSAMSLYGYTWPTYKASSEQTAKTVDTDGDGMPDWFEAQFGLDKTDASDGGKISIDRNNRYTNLEMYLHYLVRDIVEAQNVGGTYTANN